VIVSRYKPIEEFVIINENDDDLKPVVFKTPDIPNDNLIINYNLPANKQVYRRSEPPERLQALMKRIRQMCVKEPKRYPIFQDEMNRELFGYKDKYQDIHKWIMDEYHRRLYGAWYFINGNRIYVPGKMCFWMDYTHLDTGLPMYKDKDRKYFFFLEQAINDLVCYGIIEITKRRDGKSWRAGSGMVEEITRHVNAHGGIQSKNDVDAGDFFYNHIIYIWKKMQFWMQPIHSHLTRDPKEELWWDANVGQGIDQLELRSRIDYRNAKPLAYDGKRLRFYVSDEEGKLEVHDAYERWMKVKPTLRDHLGNVIGKSVHTTTVEDGGVYGMTRFKKLWNASDFHKRNELGETESGLWRIFQPAYDGLVVDHWGFSDLTAGKKKLEEQRKIMTKGDSSFYEEVRKNPWNVKEAFTINAGRCPFDKDILAKRIQVFFNGNPYLRVGDLVWKDNIIDSKVVFLDNPNGRFKLSHIPPEGIRNAVERKGRLNFPGNADMFVAGGDTFNFDNVEEEGSKGGGAVFMLLDPLREHHMQNAPEFDSQQQMDDYALKYKTNRFVCTYSYRPEEGKAAYIEDMIKMCVFYGCYMFPEMNHTHIQDGFKERGYEAYLLHRYDENKQKFSINSGDVTNDNTKDKLFSFSQQYILEHGKWEFHDDYLVECLSVDYATMTKYDLFSAAAYALYGASMLRYRIDHKRKKLQDAANREIGKMWFPEYDVSLQN
jgi:hypothetical protein